MKDFNDFKTTKCQVWYVSDRLNTYVGIPLLRLPVHRSMPWDSIVSAFRAIKFSSRRIQNSAHKLPPFDLLLM